MRVLVVTPWFPSKQAPGSGLFNLRDVRLLAREHEVTLLHLIRPRHMSDGEEDETAGEAFGIERVPYAFESPQTIVPASRRVAAMMREAELVHSMAFSALPAMRLAKPRIPWVHTEHYSQLITPPASPRMAVTLSVLKRLFRFPTETVAVSRSLAALIDRYRRTPSTVIGNEVMMPTEPVPVRRPETVGARPASLRLIGVGGVIERKGPVPAVETMIELRGRGIDASLTWVGEGDLSDRVSEIAREAGVAEHLRLTGHLSPVALSHELLDADVFLLPVETETFGVAIAEGLAHGLPVVTSGSGGHEEFLPPHASRLVGERAAEPLADAVQALLADPELWTRQRISDYAADRFSREARSAAYREVYARAVQQAAARRR